MANKHGEALLRSNAVGAAQDYLKRAAELLEGISHSEAYLVREAANRLLDLGTQEALPLYEYLLDLPEHAKF